MNDVEKQIKYAKGRVLVAGYGEGLVQKYLLENPKVSYVLTLEKNAQVIEECKKVGKIHGLVSIIDFYDFMPGEKFDTIIGSLWEYDKFRAKAFYLLNPNGQILGFGQ